MAGCIEHIFAIQQILSNAKENLQPFSLGCIDLKNAFDSVSHQYIQDMLVYIRVPAEVLAYTRNLYSSISAYVATKDWYTPHFPIQRGVFQGDTLSPLLLIAFNSLLQTVQNHPARGFSLVCGEEQQQRNHEAPKDGSFICAF